MTWREQAACRGKPTGWWFPPAQMTVTDWADYQRAREICASCPVRSECLTYALGDQATRTNGLWAGTTPDERRGKKRREAERRARYRERLRRERTFEHGTLNGYQNGACRCEPCKEAGRSYRQRRRQIERARGPLTAGLEIEETAS